MKRGLKGVNGLLVKRGAAVRRVSAPLACVSLAMAALAVVSLSSPGGAGAAANPARRVIVVEGPMTGDQASTGIDMARAAALAVSQINAVGGVDGVKLTLRRLDEARRFW